MRALSTKLIESILSKRGGLWALLLIVFIQTAGFAQIKFSIYGESTSATTLTVVGSGSATTNDNGASWTAGNGVNQIFGNSSFNYTNSNINFKTFNLSGDLTLSDGVTPIVFSAIVMDDDTDPDYDDIAFDVSSIKSMAANTSYSLSGRATFTLSGATFGDLTTGTYAGTFDGVQAGFSNFSTSDIVIEIIEGSPSALPVASNVTFSGTMSIGEELTGVYTYSHDDENPEIGSTFKWYRADNASGSNRTAIAGATSKTYTLTNNDINKYISFEVTPSDGTDVGGASESTLSGPVLGPLIIQEIARQNPTDQTISASEVTFRVTFNGNATNVTSDDFSLNSTVGGTISSVSEVTASVYDVTVNNINNVDGTLALQIKGVDGASGSNEIKSAIFGTGTKTISQTDVNDYLNQAKLGQTFTATTDNYLTAYTIYPKSGNHSFNGTADLKIYSGNELAGDATLIGSQTINISNSTDAAGQTFTIENPVSLTQGEVYSIVMENFSGSGSHALESSTSGNYNDGRVIFTGTSTSNHTDFDLKIDIYEGTVTAGNALSTDAAQTNESYILEAINLAPTVSNVTFTGTLELDEVLTGSYTYADSENDAESGTTFKWYRSDDNSGTNKTAISGATAQTYTLVADDLGKYISFEVTPNDGNVAGTAVESALSFISPVNVSSIVRQTPTDATTNADEVTFRVTFSDDVRLVTTGDFVLSGTAAADGTVSSVTSISSSVYDIRVTGITNSSGTINLDLKGVDGSGSNDIAKIPSQLDANSTADLQITDSPVFGQSFKPNNSGLLLDVVLKNGVGHSYSGAGTLELISGEGYGGTVLATENIQITSAQTEKTYSFSSPASVTAGTTYTLRVNIPGAPANSTAFSAQVEAGYSGGILYQASAFSNADLYFKLFVSSGPSEALGSTLPATDETYTISNPPVASNVAITGTLNVGQQLTGTYDFSDPQSDTESGSIFKWYRADNASGTNKAAIAEATTKTYTLVLADAGKFISFEVTPSDGTNTGDAVESTAQQINNIITVQSIARQTPTDATINSNTSPVFRVIFSENVKNVSSDDFSVSSTVGGSVSNVSQVDASTYEVTVNNLNHVDGTLSLKLKGIDGTAGSNDIVGISYSNGAAAHQQTTENDYLNQALIGQTFTAGSNNFLTAFTLFAKSGNHTFSGTARLRIYQDDASNSSVLNDGNAILSEETVNISSSTDASGQTFTISNPSQLTSGSVYSITLDNFIGSGNRAFYAHTSGSLAGGRAFFTNSNNSNHAAFDFKIDIFEGTQTDGEALFDQAPGTEESYTVEVDNTPPTVTITSSSNPTSGAFTATFTFSEDVSGFASEDISVSNAAVSNFNTTSAKIYTATMTPLADGDVDIDVLANKVTDAAGNNNTAATQLSVTNDETAPAAPIVASISTDAGSSATDNLTNDQTLEISGTAEANASIEVFIGGNSIGNTTANGSGDWTYDHTGSSLTETTHSITAKATDAAGNESALSGTLNITIDTSAPSVSTGTIVGKTYGLTENVDVTYVFSETVFVDETNGTPSVIIAMGGQNRVAAYHSGSGTNTLVFRYTTVAGDIDGNGVSVSSIGLNGGTIQDAAGNDASTSISVAGAADVRVDTSAPYMSITSSSNTVSGAFTATFTFNEDVSGFDVSDISVGNGVASNFNTTSAKIYTATITPSADGNVTVNVAANKVQDAGGNGNSAASELRIVNDEIAPSAPIVASISTDSGSSAKDNLTNDQTLEISGTAEANASVEVFIAGNSVGNTTADGSGDWTFDHTGSTLTEATHSITARATDAAGNESAESIALSVEIDITAPNAPVVTGIGNDTGISDSDGLTNDVGIEIYGTAEANSSVEIFIDNASVGTTNADANGDWTLDRSRDALTEDTYDITAKATDLAGNESVASSVFDLQIDLTGPASAPSVGAVGNDNGPSNSDFITNDQTLIIGGNASFNSRVEVFIDGMSTGIAATNAQGTWLFDHEGTTLQAGTYSITAKELDDAGNHSPASAAKTLVIDLVQPTVTITSNANDPHNGEFTAIFTFSEDVSGFDVSDINVGNGAASNFATTSASIYTATITPATDGEVTLDVAGGAAQDVAGNNNSAATQFSITNDETAPTVLEVTSNVNNTSFKIGDQVNIYVQYSEEVFVTGTPQLELETGDTDRTIDYVDRSSSTLRFVYTVQTGDVSEDLDVTSTSALSLNGGTIVDAVNINADLDVQQGDVGGSLTSKNIVIDGVAPGLAITSDANDPQSGAFTATFTFSESVTGFDASDISVGNGAASNFSATSATLYTATITPSSDGEVTVDVAAGKATDIAGNGNTAATQLSVTNDETAPTVTISSSADPTSGLFTATFTFSEEIFGFDLNDITVGNGTKGNLNLFSASVYTATITPTVEGEVTIDVAADVAQDDAGNNNVAATQHSVAYDATEPSLVSALKDSDTKITLTFNEAVKTLGAHPTDFTVTDGNSTNFTVQTILDGTAEDNDLVLTFADLSTAKLSLEIFYTNNNGEVSDLAGNQMSSTRGGVIISLNTPPTATNVDFSGNLIVGETLTGAYTYSDEDNDAEDGTTFQWYRSDDANGTNKAAIADATSKTYALTSADVDKYTSFEVTPHDGNNAGNAVESSLKGAVSKIDQTITFEPLTAKTYGDATFTLSATASSNLGVTYTSSNTSVATVNGSTVTIIGAGETTITASQAGDVSYAVATNATQLLTVNKAVLTATADDKSKTYGEANPTFTISYTGFVNGDDANAITTEPTASTLADATAGVGTYDIDLTGGVADNYSFNLSSGTLTIGKAVLTATADDKSKTYGEVNPTFTITYTGFVNGDDANAITTEPTASTLAVATSGVGTYDINLAGGAADNYSFNLGRGALTINKATLTATADDRSKTYGEANPELTISYAGFVNGDDETVITMEPTASTLADATSGVGTYDIDLAGGTADNYSFSLTSGTLTVNKAVLTATADDKSKTYGEANPTFTISYTGFVNGDDANAITTEPTASTVADATTGVGAYDIDLAGGTADNYSFTLASGTLTINKAVLTATADDKSKTYGEANPEFTISYTGFVNGDQESDITEPTTSSTTDVTSDAGTYEITLSAGLANNYSIIMNNGTLTIGKATLTATAEDKQRAVGQANPAFTISYTGFVNGDEKSVIDSEPIASTTADETTVAGTAAITLSGGSDNNYAFDFVNGTLTIVEASFVTSVSVPDDGTYAIGDEMSFTVNFALPVTITGAPSLPLTIGSSIVAASLKGSITDATTATFSYTVEEGDLDSDGLVLGSSIELNGGSIRDEFGTDAILALNNVPSTAGVLVDAVAPAVTLTTAVGALTNTKFEVNIRFDEVVTGFALSDIQVSNGTASNLVEVIAGKQWTVEITPGKDGTVTVGLPANKVTDTPGNANKAGNTISSTFDGTAPRVTSITRKTANPLLTAIASFRAIFSEDVTGVDLTDFEVIFTGTATGRLSTITQVNAKTYDVNIEGISGEGTIGLNIKNDQSILDAANNPLEGAHTGEVYKTNQSPTEITINASSIAENNQVAAVIGSFTTIDADQLDGYTYSLVTGTGSVDNDHFFIDGSTLKAASVFDYETKSSYSIRVKTDDGRGGAFEKVFKITVTNVAEPKLRITSDIDIPATALGLTSNFDITVHNDGEAALIVNSVLFPEGFIGAVTGIIVNPGESRTIAFGFKPTEVKIYTGTIQFITNAGTVSVNVSGEGAIITGVDDGAINPETISIFPNPASKILNIDLSDLGGKKLDIDITNASGTPLFSRKSFTEKILQLSVSGYTSGIYIIQITDGKSVVRKKVMIKR
ncbi:putative secreted protein (Por secretion system target) [Roseivirga ehrenbergii]|uniref:Cadherin domain-containing protein n=1 Tax=Roseivirga ehrenbergii (strain DSM 102268 / JCM 13514 / KCTC 12282 / NCIMB 14502 / KMM 6017) TaxID=279360 RepID=A0A150WXY6_ROSEK|nr:MBG domain-containing protein [Roseivirga ehrenbergii]KYG71348.1 hypothetical protein MB14_11265 [Roseivirga ehrenbergii]TCK99607.1 putative secreted protein (Por secretion system target) [Roseivirga ehrenbergii]